VAEGPAKGERPTGRGEPPAEKPAARAGA
jgi:hypothetical protein